MLATWPVVPGGARGRGRSARPPLPTSPALEKLLRGKKVLVLGDSMIVTGLEIWAKQLIRRHGGTYRRVSWASSTTKKWATTGKLERSLARHRPDVVLVVLGSNELYLDHPEKMGRHVRAIVKKIGDRPFWWLGPPVWRRQTGIVEVIKTNVPSGRFYPFNDRDIHRHKDGRHPSVRGSRTWLTDFARWWIARLQAEAASASR